MIEDVTLSPPRAGEVQVRIAASGVCRSDHHVMSGATRHPMPVVCGHEGAGVVTAVGPGVTHVKPADHVVLSWAPSCGSCFYCRAGLPAQCEAFIKAVWDGTMIDGTTRLKLDGRPLHHYCLLASFAEQAVVPASCCVPIRKDVPLAVAALVGCAVATGVGAALYRAKVAPGASVVVFGCGGVGVNIVQGCLLSGAERIIAVDRNPARLAMARDLGATDVVDASGRDPVEMVRQLTGGRGADYAFEAIGNPATMGQAIEAARRGGTIVLVGLGGHAESIHLGAGTFTRSDKLLTSAYYGGCVPQLDMPKLIDLYVEGRLKLDELIGRRRPLSEINEAFADLATGDVIRTLIVFDA
jgi:S-(hydroxymethyl)glutathione dehydrogenase/alcohol dehydrogenase